MNESAQNITLSNKIVHLKISEVKPYFRNARRNDGAVKYVAQSIKDFGFKNPIIVDAHNVVICGHTRLKAAKKLGLETVPVIVADDLPENKVRAFRLADNKVGEIAEWDTDLLRLEVPDIDLRLSDYGFDEEFDRMQGKIVDFDDEVDEQLSAHLKADEGVEGDNFTRVYDPSIIMPSSNRAGIPDLRLDMCADVIPTEAFFRRAEQKNTDCLAYPFAQNDWGKLGEEIDVKNGAVCFYTEDQFFERMWNDTQASCEMLLAKGFKNAIGLDFSVNADFPLAVKLYQKYRSMRCNRAMQDFGIKVIPSVTIFSTKSDPMREFDLAGIPKGAPTIMLQCQTNDTGDIGRTMNKLLSVGVTRIIDEIQPKRICLYGSPNVLEYDIIPLLPNFEYHICSSWVYLYGQYRKNGKK